MRIFSVVAAMVLCLPSTTSVALDVTGVWVADKGVPGWAAGINDKYGVSFIRDGTNYCGVLSWLKDAAELDKKGRGLAGATVFNELRENTNTLTGKMYYWRKDKEIDIKITFESNGREAEICSAKGEIIEGVFQCLNLKKVSDGAHPPFAGLACNPIFFKKE